MAAGVVGTLWSFEDLYDEVMTLSFKDEKAMRVDRFLNAVQQAENR